MDGRKRLFGIFVGVLCGVISVMSQEDVGVEIQLKLRENGYQIDADMLDAIEIFEEEYRPSLSSIINTHMLTAGIQIDARAKSLPETKDDDVCYFVVGFLSPLHIMNGHKSFPNRTECYNNLRMYANDYNINMSRKYMPDIGVADEILKYPKCLNYSEDLSKVDFTHVIGDINRTHCGMYRLVVMLDPLHVIHEDTDFCNNYVTVDIFFNCSRLTKPIEPTCELVHTDSDDKSLMLLFKNHEIHHTYPQYSNGYQMQHMSNVHMYRNFDESHSWHEETPRMMERDMIGEDRHERNTMMKLLKPYIEGKMLTDGEKMCSKDSMMSQLDELMDMKEESVWEESVYDTDDDYRGFLGQMLDFVDAMHNRSRIPQLLDRVRSLLNEHMTTRKPLNSRAAILMNMTELAETILANKVDYAKKKVAMTACEVSHDLERTMVMFTEGGNMYNADGSRNFDANAISHFVNTTSALGVRLMFFYPQYYRKCYANILVHLNNLTRSVSGGAHGDLSWMYNKNVLDRIQNYTKNMTGFPYNNKIGSELKQKCRKLNSCIVKLRDMCGQTDQGMMGYEKPVQTLHEEVCKLKALKEMIRRHVQRPRNTTMDQEKIYDRVCNGERTVLSQMQTAALTKIVDGKIMKGRLNLDNTMVTWQPVALCRCEKCAGTSPNKDEYGFKAEDEYKDEYGYKNEYGYKDDYGNKDVYENKDEYMDENVHKDEPEDKPEEMYSSGDDVGESEAEPPPRPPNSEEEEKEMYYKKK